MPYYVRLPDNRDIEFPDNYPRDDAIRVARDMFRQPVERPAVAAPVEERSLLGGAISRGYNTLQSSLGSAAEGAGSVLGIESLRNYGAESRRRNQQEAEQAQPADRRATFEDANSFGGYARATGQAVAESLPSTGLGLAGGIAGGALGSFLGPAGTAAGAIGGRTLGAFLGSSLASLPTFYGSNRQRQIEESTPRDAEGRPTGEGRVSSEGAAFGAAVPQAAMEGVTDVLLGRLGRFFRGGTEEVGKSFLPRVAQGIGVGAASEVPTEVLQQALERAQAGLDLQSPEAYREYREATIAAIAAGGTMGGVIGGALGRRPAPATAREQEDEELRRSLQIIAQQRATESAPQAETAVPNANEAPVDNGVMAKAAVAPTAPMAQQPPTQMPVQAAPEAAPVVPQVPVAPPPAATQEAPIAPVEQAPIEPIAPIEPTPEAIAPVELVPPVEPAPVAEVPTQVLPPVPPMSAAPEPTAQQAVDYENDFPGITEELRSNPAAVNRAIRRATGQRANWQDLSNEQRQDVYNLLQTEYAAAPQATTEAPEVQPALQAQQIIAPEPAKLAQAQRYVADQIEAIRRTGKQGESIAAALDAVAQDPTYHPMQVYGALVAGNSMARVLPQNADHRIEFTKTLIKPATTDLGKAQAAASGVTAETGAAGGRNASEQLITISLAPEALREVRQTGAHEAFHVLQDYYAKYDPNFMKAANAAFTEGSTIASIDKSIKKKLESIRLPANTILPRASGDKKYNTYWDVLNGYLGDKKLSAREQQAYTYAALYDAARYGTPMTGLKPSMTRFVNFLRDFFASVRNTLNGNGFNNANDLFSRAVDQGGSQFEGRQLPAPAAKPAAQAAPQDDTEFAAARTNVNTPGFAEWFEGSEITDPDGPPVFFKGTKVPNPDMTPRIMYHGSGALMKRFGKAKSAAQAGEQGPFFFSESPDLASYYAETPSLDSRAKGERIGRVYPVYISAKNVFNPRNADHRDQLLSHISKGLENGSITYKDMAANVNGRLLLSMGKTFANKEERNNYVISRLSKNMMSDGESWIGLELKPVQKFIRSNGYDGFYVNENGARNVAVFDPKQIKSIFNDFAPGVKDDTEFAAVANGATGGLPPIGQRVPPVTQTMANGTELQIEYNVAAKALGKRLGKYIEPAKIERFFTSFQDSMLPVARMVDDINANGGNVSQAMNTYVQQDLLSGRTADMLKQRNEGLYQKLINGIAASNVGMDDFENYLYARHAEERNNYIATINPEMPDGGSGMSNGRAQEVLDEFANAGKIPELEKLAVMFDAIIADTNKLRSEYGLTPDFSQMTVDSEGKLLPNYKSYAPLKGFADESVDADEPINEFRSKGSRMLGAKGREDMQAMGRKRMAGDIVAHAMMQNTQAVVRSQKNAVGQSFLEMLRANPDQTQGIAQILSRPMTRTAIVNGVVKVVPDIMYKGRPDILVVKEGGKETVVQIKDEAIARSMIGATSNAPTTNSALIKGMIALNSYLAKINTAYNPEFMITNFFRDLQTFGVNVEQFDVDGLRSDSIRDVRAAMSGIRDVVRGTDNNPEMAGYYNRLKELGGTNEAYGFADLDTRINEINKTMAKAGTTAKSWRDMAKVIAPVGKFIEDYNTIVENGIRTSVFKNMVERGINEQQAAYIAKNVTVNFTKGGENRVFMNAMYLFYNASLQGTMAMVNAMGRSQKVRKIVAGIMVAGLMQDALNSMLSGEGEDGEKVYDKIPDHILKRSFIMMDPFGLTERGYLSFPMPYGFNAFFNMGREMGKVARGASSPMDGAGNILGTFVDAFNPVGGSNSFFNFVAPTIADPLVDIARNRDFADRPIVPERGGFGVQPPESQKYWNNTFAPFVGISSFLNEITGGTSVIPGAVDISPNMINYLFNFATGAAGKFVERSFTTATTTIPSMLVGDFSEVEAREIPLARSLIGNVTSRNDMERYMQRTQEVLQIRQEIRAANEAGDSERVAAAFERYPGQIEIMDSINKLARDRSKLTREINSISRNENIPEDVRRDLVKQLREQQNQLVGLANRLYNQRVTNRD